MPITPHQDVVFIDNTGGYRRNALTDGMAVLDAEAMILRAFRTTDHRDGGLTSVQPRLLVSVDGGRTYDPAGVLPDSGSAVTTGLTPDTWQRGPWVWNLTDGAQRTHCRIALEFLGERIGFARAQLEYSVRRREVARVPCYRRVIGNSDGPGRWRLTDAIRPHVETATLRATFALHALKAMSGTPAVRPIWFFNRSPGDETDWTFGGYIDTAFTTAGTHTCRPAPVSGLTDNLLVAFGFEITRTGGTAGHTAFALIEGTFALY